LEAFGIVDEAGEDNDAEDEEEDEKSKLLGRGFKGVHQDFKAGGVAG